MLVKRGFCPRAFYTGNVLPSPPLLINFLVIESFVVINDSINL